MAFTSWAALKAAILDDMASGSILTQSYSFGNRSRSFRNMAEVIEFLKYCDYQIEVESRGRKGPVIRYGVPI